MRIDSRVTRAAVVFFVSTWMAGRVYAAETPVKPAGGSQTSNAQPGTIVFDAACYWRIFPTLQPCAVLGSDGVVSVVTNQGQPSTPLPPADWAKPDFDDGGWWRDPGPVFDGPGVTQGANLALLAMRGKFLVHDASKIKDLTLSMSFRGGVVAYLNGKEVARSHLPAGKLDPLALAESYPEEAHGFDPYHFHAKDLNAAEDRRRRKIAGVKIGTEGLRNGMNVLALEIRRAPLRQTDSGGNHYTKMWNSAGLLDLRLESASTEGIEPAVSRPKGLQIWNALPMEFVLDVDYGTPGETLRPVRIPAVRNGVFSGVVVLSSDSAIRDLCVKRTDLQNKKTGGSIKAEGVMTRYAVGGGRVPDTPVPRPFYGGWSGNGWDSYRGSMPTAPWNLQEIPPLEVPVATLGKMDTGYHHIRGAVVPIWVTVSVPRGIAPGAYEGVLNVSAQGGKFDVPIEVRVSEWALPSQQEFKSFCDSIQSPESLRYAYNVKPWSEEHFKLMGRTFDLIRGLGNKTVYIPVLTRTNFGNEEGMIRWIKNADGSYECDFSLMEKYVDLAMARLGKVEHVCFEVWSPNLGGSVLNDAGWPGSGYGGAGGAEYLPGDRHRPIRISYLDPATGVVSEGTGPTYTDAGAKAFWQPFVEGIAERLKKRGLEKAIRLGLLSDARPLKEVMIFWKEELPDASWISSGHIWLKELYGSPVVYATQWRWPQEFQKDSTWDKRFGWRDNKTILSPYRVPLTQYPPSYFWNMYEQNLCGGMDGLGRLFSDFFAVRTQGGKGDYRLLGRYVDTSAGTMNWGETWLAPGPDGAIASVAYESLRNGIQESEARIFIQDAILDRKDKLGDALAKRAQDVLDERGRRIWCASLMPGGNAARLPPYGEYWRAGSGWPETTEILFDTAAEIAAALNAKR